MAHDIAVTAAPRLVKSQKDTGWPERSAIPTATMFALAPTGVRLPPITVPSSKAHHSTPELSWPGMESENWATIGVIAAAYGTLLMKLPSVNEMIKMSRVALHASPR